METTNPSDLPPSRRRFLARLSLALSGFIGAVATGDRSRVLSGPRESLHTHLAVFAAERARRSGSVVTLA